MSHGSDLFDKGLETRRAVLGSEYVDQSIKGADAFTMPFQEMVTEYCWGEVWNRPGLSRRDRSLMNLAMLTALHASNELKLHVRGAVNNGLSVEEIREAIIHATVYCGVPAGLEALKTAHATLGEMGALPGKD